MAGVTVTGEVVREQILEPALDALAANQQQHDLLINTTPEVDSLVEWVASLRRFGVPGEQLRIGLRYCQQVIELNRDEADRERLVTGTADRIARGAEDAARSERSQGGLTVRALARELRPLLRTIKQGNKSDPMEYVRACRKVARIVDQTSVDRLLCTFMRTELGPRSYALLVEFATEEINHDNSGA